MCNGEGTKLGLKSGLVPSKTKKRAKIRDPRFFWNQELVVDMLSNTWSHSYPCQTLYTSNNTLLRPESFDTWVLRPEILTIRSRTLCSEIWGSWQRGLGYGFLNLTGLWPTLGHGFETYDSEQHGSACEFETQRFWQYGIGLGFV